MARPTPIRNPDIVPRRGILGPTPPLRPCPIRHPIPYLPVETDHQVKYIATALDSGEIHYPSYMVCFFVLSL